MDNIISYLGILLLQLILMIIPASFNFIKNAPNKKKSFFAYSFIGSGILLVLFYLISGMLDYAIYIYAFTSGITILLTYWLLFPKKAKHVRGKMQGWLVFALFLVSTIGVLLSTELARYSGM